MSDELATCGGPGTCHGCALWCDRCGDVSTSCDAADYRCHRHHCTGCTKPRPRETLGDEWWWTCADCEIQRELERAEADVLMFGASDNPSDLYIAQRMAHKIRVLKGR